MSGWGLAIDFGTTFTAVAVVEGDSVELIEVEDGIRFPSWALARDGEVMVGKAAFTQARRWPQSFERSPKRLIGQPAVLLDGKAVPVVALVAAVLRRAYEAALTRQGDAEPAWVWLTHPAIWQEERLQVLRAAARDAGIGRCELLSEPEAAAWFFVRDRRGNEPDVEIGQCVAIYDLGGGTFDTAILRRDAEGFSLAGQPGGDDWFGGEDFDERLLDHILRQVEDRDHGAARQLAHPITPSWQRARLQLQRDVREAKEALSSTARVSVLVSTADDVIDVEVTRGEFEDLIREDLQRTVATLESTVHRAGLAREDIAAVYLTGGSSRVPLAAALLAQFHPHTYTRPDPKTLVAHGAALRKSVNGPVAVTPRGQGATTAETPAALEERATRGRTVGRSRVPAAPPRPPAEPGPDGPEPDLAATSEPARARMAALVTLRSRVAAQVRLTRVEWPRRVPAIPAQWRKVAAVVVAAAVVLAAVVWAAGGGKDGNEAVLTRHVHSPALGLSYPASWKPSSVRSPPRGLALRDAVALAPKEGPIGARLIAGMTHASGVPLLPRPFARSVHKLPARDDRVRLGHLDAFRYSGLRARGSTARYTILAGQTTAGVLTVVCILPPGVGRTTAGTCERIAGSALLRTGRPLALGPNKDYAKTVNRSLQSLSASRTSLRRQLAGAATPDGQARSALGLARAHRRAHRAIARADPTPLDAVAQRDLLAALRAAESAYGALANATRGGHDAAYAAAARRVRRADAAIERALLTLHRNGYGG